MVQLSAMIEHVRHIESQSETQRPKLIRRGTGHYPKHSPSWKTAFNEQLVQLVIIIEHVKHRGSQDKHCWLGKSGIVVFSGHVKIQLSLWKKCVVMQDKHSDSEVHSTHGDTHAVHVQLLLFGNSWEGH